MATGNITRLEGVWPETHERAVRDSAGVNLETKLGNINSNISQLDQKVREGYQMEDSADMIGELDLNWLDNYFFRSTDGGSGGSSSYAAARAYVPIPQGTSKIRFLGCYTNNAATTVGTCLFYNAGKTLLSTVVAAYDSTLSSPASREMTVNVPANATYVRFSLLKADKASMYCYAINETDIPGLKDINGKASVSDVTDFRRTISPVYDWKQGGINANGSEPDSGTLYTTRIKTGNYFLSTGESVSFNIAPGYLYRLYRYGSGKVFEAYLGEFSGAFSYKTESGKYYRFVVCRASGAAIYPGDALASGFNAGGLQLDNETGLDCLLRPLYEDERNVALKGKTIAFIGDSITNGSSASDASFAFPALVAARYGAYARILAYDGACIADNAKNNLSSHRLVTFATAENLGDVDLVIVLGGTNDFSYDSKAIGPRFVENTITPYGNVGDKELAAPGDADTFAGALHELIDTIRTNAAGAPVIFMTPLHRNQSGNNPTDKQCNSNGDFLVDFANAIKEICAFYSVPVLDLYGASNMILRYSMGEFNNDALHPNDKGHRIIADMLFRFIEQHIVSYQD